MNLPEAMTTDPHGTRSAPGRHCPLHYRYRPEDFRVEAPAVLQSLEVLYVVGGLYGNELALARVLELFDRERGRKRLVFNGDFHWFDADPAAFARVQHAVLAHQALRGNVETELANPDPQADAGCGCAYPEWVGDGVVQRSNRILARLRTATDEPQRRALSALPMWLRADVGPLRLGLVHGDADLARRLGLRTGASAGERRTAPRWRAGWFERAGVQAFACSHTCLPVFRNLAPVPASVRAPEPGVGGDRWVLNNGAAGMPNFAGDAAGLLVRVALGPFDGDERRFGIQRGEVFADAVAIEYDAAAWRARFLADWPAGSDAHASYFERIQRGPTCSAAQTLRGAT
jgi:hypothetical protein